MAKKLSICVGDSDLANLAQAITVPQGAQIVFNTIEMVWTKVILPLILLIYSDFNPIVSDNKGGVSGSELSGCLSKKEKKRKRLCEKKKRNCMFDLTASIP